MADICKDCGQKITVFPFDKPPPHCTRCWHKEVDNATPTAKRFGWFIPCAICGEPPTHTIHTYMHSEGHGYKPASPTGHGAAQDRAAGEEK